MPGKKLDFEKSMGRLEEIVELLEQGETGLEKSLALFEEGMGLLRSCSELLDKAEQKVSELQVKSDGTPDEAPFDTDE